MKRVLAFAVLSCAVLFGDALRLGSTAAAVPQDEDQALRAVLVHLEEVLLRGDEAGFRALLAATADPGAADEFVANELRPGVTRAVIRERGRGQLPGTPQGAGYRLVVDA